MDFGERSSSVDPNPEILGDINVLEIPFGQDSDKFARVKSYHVDHATQTVIFDELWPVEQTPQQVIDELENQLLIMSGVI